MVIKYCFVPSCINNNRDKPNKIFIRIPLKREIRTKWYEAVYPDISKINITKTNMLFCCEDHFDLKNDSENWMQYTMIAKNLLMKRDAVPHKNLNGRDKNPEEEENESQFDSNAKRRKQETIEKFLNGPQPIASVFLPCTTLVPPSSLINSSSISNSSSCELNLALGKMYISEGTQAKPQVNCVYTQVSMRQLKPKKTWSRGTQVNMRPLPKNRKQVSSVYFKSDISSSSDSEQQPSSPSVKSFDFSDDSSSLDPLEEKLYVDVKNLK